ncbi:Nitrogenase stabilizing/protective protein NifW [Paramagnetospirillum magnetotacticum MS-1]|uniref:Nitrogenase-stabilizing/protective protein NifW n=1 Tax=Paramagnetospirillum magnetotacticum MS-1 TaxID=272627 RepID=A0A0C2V576_PARME|nr:nitrogenase-stabilizing/protective protein NifW [Paramagnetospirillum magnetotacticum]KIM00217.1 Nitrogenase stabilizing/protective protein NifW [Paramagnetospirillum magnetotacticum MS-1]
MILDTLATLSAAEQFFETLGVHFEQSVLNVSRLHILKRFREVLRSTNIEGLAEYEVEAVCRAALIEAYEDFAEGRGTKTFKVFKDAHPGFVGLSEIRPMAAR